MASTGGIRSLFSRPHEQREPQAEIQPTSTRDRPGFAYLATEEIYLDSACQTLRPQPVIDAMAEYYTQYNACGDRVKYDWGRRVDARVAATREAVLRTLDLSPRRYECAFTLNTTYGLNLLLHQLPAGRYARVVTTHTEHNSVFLSTMSFARRAGIPRVVVERTDAGEIQVADADLTGAVVVVSAMDNVCGTTTANLDDLIACTHRAGGTVIVDAAQAAPHALAALRGTAADAVCFSAHKMYGPSLGVVAATRELLESLELSFIGGGQVASVTETDFVPASDLHTRLEPGLQAWAEIIGFGAALEWLAPRREALEHREQALARRLFDGLLELPHLRVVSPSASAVVSVLPERVDGHRLATFLSKAHISVRSGYFCAHHWLIERAHLGPLVRFSLGAHNTEADVDGALEAMGRLMRGL
ncbi:aminotransferase class V-fold PLP-dependent enzyme [Microbacterium sp.]|uniref:aminotransferase class V-fold PLP-dependent enzyme n=1 Tax=Microbacterium sp. TaxID=51671 RepID=UPI003C767CE5